MQARIEFLTRKQARDAAARSFRGTDDRRHVYVACWSFLHVSRTPSNDPDEEVESSPFC